MEVKKKLKHQKINLTNNNNLSDVSYNFLTSIQYGTFSGLTSLFHLQITILLYVNHPNGNGQVVIQ